MISVIYTVGYGAMRPRDLAALAEGLDATVIDIRGRPSSRRPGFGGRQLAALLGERYQWRGDKLGGVNHLSRARSLWPAACRRLVEDMRARALRPLLLCQCHEPGGCHRHQVALELAQTPRLAADPPLRVVHVFERESIEAGELQRALSAGDDYTYMPWTTPDDLLPIWEDDRC
jgi:hypothetical protein